MGKRSSFDRVEKDAYMTTDPRAIESLVNFIGYKNLTYYEPCVGDGSLVKLLPFHCVGQSDLELDARITKYDIDGVADIFITNPPWSRNLLHPIIDNLRKQKPTWLLFDADWMHTQQAIPYMKYCKIVLSIGRLKWIPGSKMDGKDNCAWYLFVDYATQCTFVPRIKR